MLILLHDILFYVKHEKLLYDMLFYYCVTGKINFDLENFVIHFYPIVSFSEKEIKFSDTSLQLENYKNTCCMFFCMMIEPLEMNH